MADVDEVLRKDRDVLRKEIQNGISNVRRAARRYRRVSGTLLLIAMLSGALGTVLAGDAFRGGSIAADVAQSTTGKVPSDLPKGWRNVCGIIALLTFIGTLATGTNTILKINEHQTKAFLCAGALDALEAELLQEAGLRRPILDKVVAELVKVRREYSEYLF